MDKEQKIIDSWIKNAGNWIELIENNKIESRKLVTNKAIIDAVIKNKPQAVLDIGCGEGWLLKILQDKGIIVTGVDVIPVFIEKAKQQIRGDFLLASYEDLASGKIQFTRLFDLIVINFALIGKESTETLLKALPPLLVQGGCLLIQTLHPDSRKIMNDDVSGWKEGSWNGLGDQFKHPYRWYYRTMDDWMNLLHRSGFNTVHVTEFFHPENQQPLSVIFDCKVRSI
jgi:2-polyprenyl-3-methyl-5-hydroxy-6-metoxy-1,4-benzoquinol methylase